MSNGYAIYLICANGVRESYQRARTRREAIKIADNMIQGGIPPEIAANE